MTCSLTLSTATLENLHLFPAALLAVFALVNCFFGYMVFRVLLAVYGTVGGMAIGISIVAWARAEPTTVDYVVAAGALAVLLGLLSWYVFRVAFAALVAVVVAALLARVFGDPPPVGGWVVGGIVGAVAGLMAFAELRRVVVFFTAVTGGFSAVFIPAIAYAGPEGLAALGPFVGAAIFIAGAGLSVGGFFAQSKLARVFDTGLTPRRRKRQPTGSTALRPPFTRV